MSLLQSVGTFGNREGHSEVENHLKSIIAKLGPAAERCPETGQDAVHCSSRMKVSQNGIASFLIKLVGYRQKIPIEFFNANLEPGTWNAAPAAGLVSGDMDSNGEYVAAGQKKRRHLCGKTVSKIIHVLI